MSFFGTPLSLTSIDNANHALAARVDVNMTNLDGLLMAAPVPIESLD
jgi:hypothetical protein